MEQNNKPTLPLNGAVVRLLLLLAILAAFVVAAGAPICFRC